MRRALSATLIVAMLSPACKMKGDGAAEPTRTAAMDNAAPSAAPDPTGGAAAGSGMAADEGTMGKQGDKGGDEKKKDNDTPATWKRSTIVPNASRLMVGEHEELALRAMQSRVTIEGFRARVLIDYVYENATDRQLEGTFQLRLPEEATPYFFAFGESVYAAESPKLQIASQAVEPEQIMDARKTTWEKPRIARMVPREKAAFAYAQTERRRVDPALVEWAGAGVFAARVFPLAPRKLQRIVVGYDMDLVRIGDDLEYHFDVPEGVKSPSIDVAVAENSGAKVVATPAVAAIDEQGRKLFHFTSAADHAVAIRVRGVHAATIMGEDAAGRFFASQTPIALPTSAAAGNDTAVFALDTSLSSNPDRFNIYLKLMRAVLDKNRGQLKKFAVLFFSVDAHWYKPAFVDNTPANVDALLAQCNQLALEGATDLGAAFGELAQPAWLKDSAHYDVFLLSDGAATWGESDLHALARTLTSGDAGTLFAYQTGLAGTDLATLSHLARETGGAVFSVTGESEIDNAAIAHRARPWRLAGVQVEGASDVMLAGRPRTLFPGQTLVVVGRGTPSATAQLVLDLERDGKHEIVKTPLGAAIESRLAPRAYGQVATNQLEELEAATEATSKAYATHFRITGRTCSLLMLETEADYERFGIKPEADAEVVRTTPAAALFAKTLAQVYETLGDPKAAFLAMLNKLEHTPGVTMNIPDSYRKTIAAMPNSAFDVPTAPLQTNLVAAKMLPKTMIDTLAKHELDYDVVTDDSKARLHISGAADSLKALSSLVEENPGDAVLARDVAFSAMDLGLRPQAYHLLRRVAALRPYEPQTYRAMAQALADMGKPDLALAYYEIPLMGQWDSRFGDLNAIVAIDYLRFLRGAVGNGKLSAIDYARGRMTDLAEKIGIKHADVVVTIMWNTDNTDVDLHVIEPSGEECFYGHRETRSGGQLTRDVTQGYGPEMYVLPNAPHGKYQVFAHYFASDRNRASARTKVYVRTFEDWGSPQERMTEKVLTLELGKEQHEIAMLSR